MLAIWLELRLTKDQILERYLSSAYFGEGCFGVRAAAQHFFDKPVGELKLWESALMVALLRSPTQLINNLDDANQRARLVMQAMVRDGRLDAASLADVQPAQLDPGEDDRGRRLLCRLADRNHAEGHGRAALPPAAPGPHDLRSRTSAHGPGRRSIACSKSRAAGRMRARRRWWRCAPTAGWWRWSAARTRAAASSTGRCRRGGSPARRSRLSSIWRRCGPARVPKVVVDEPISIDGWEPKNYDGGHRGTVTLTQAFAASINTVAVSCPKRSGARR